MGEGVLGLGEPPEHEEVDPVERRGHDPDLYLVRRTDRRSGHLDGLDLFETAEALHGECPHAFRFPCVVSACRSWTVLQDIWSIMSEALMASPRAAGFAAGSCRRMDAMREIPNMEMGWSGQGWMDPMPSTPPPPPPAPEPKPAPRPTRSKAALAAATVIVAEEAVVGAVKRAVKKAVRKAKRAVRRAKAKAAVKKVVKKVKARGAATEGQADREEGEAVGEEDGPEDETGGERRRPGRRSHESRVTSQERPAPPGLLFSCSGDRPRQSTTRQPPPPPGLPRC